MSPPTEPPRQVLMHPALVADFDKWLAARGLECRPAPALGPDVWLITPTDAAMAGLPARRDP